MNYQVSEQNLLIQEKLYFLIAIIMVKAFIHFLQPLYTYRIHLSFHGLTSSFPLLIFLHKTVILLKHPPFIIHSFLRSYSVIALFKQGEVRSKVLISILFLLDIVLFRLHLIIMEWIN